MRVLVVTNLWPTPERPAVGGFVRDQVEALRKIDGLEVEAFHVEPGGIRPYPREARERLGLDPGGRYLLFPADPARPEKRHDRAAELASHARAELLTYGGTPPEKVPDMINATNAVLVTSEREGFGLATLEALASDVPVVATDVGIAPVALSGVTGTLCAPYDRDAWLKAV